MVQSFRDLPVWQRSIQLATSVYRLTQGFPREEIYGLTSQMRRSAVSIPSNIAEGHGRLTVGEYRQFLGISRGSNFELQTDNMLIDETEALSHEVGKMVYAILGKINDSV